MPLLRYSLISILVDSVILILSVSGGQPEYFNYIEDGKVTEEQMYAELPLDDVAGMTSDPPAGWNPTPEMESFLSSQLAYYPSPDDDGTYIRIDMSDTAGLEFHDTQGRRPVTYIMSIPGFSFWPHRVNEEDVKFYLFTRKDTGPQGIEMWWSKDNRETVHDTWFEGAPVKILCHGYQSSTRKPFPQLMMKAYLELGKALNIILVDWHGLASSLDYFHVAKETTGVGQQVAALVRSMIHQRLVTIDMVHFIGHSLGAHVGGAMGYTLEQEWKIGHIGRITGLDPAGPGFCDQTVGQLQPSDGRFVDVIHTDDSGYCKSKLAWLLNRTKGRFGSSTTSGHSTFFPNGGQRQPGCGTGYADTCSHSRAYYYMEESYNSTVAGDTNTIFKTCPCSSYRDYLSGECECTSQNMVMMGEYTPANLIETKFFLKTGHKYPYSHVG